MLPPNTGKACPLEHSVPRCEKPLTCTRYLAGKSELWHCLSSFSDGSDRFFSSKYLSPWARKKFSGLRLNRNKSPAAWEGTWAKPSAGTRTCCFSTTGATSAKQQKELPLWGSPSCHPLSSSHLCARKAWKSQGHKTWTHCQLHTAGTASGSALAALHTCTIALVVTPTAWNNGTLPHLELLPALEKHFPASLTEWPCTQANLTEQARGDGQTRE